MDSEMSYHFGMLYEDIEVLVEKQIETRKKNLTRLGNILFYPSVITLIGLWLVDTYITFPYLIYFLTFLPIPLAVASVPPLSTIIASMASLLMTIALPAIASSFLRKMTILLKLPVITSLMINTLIIFPLWIVILDVWLFPWLAMQTIDYIKTILQIFGLNFAFFLLVLGSSYIISSMLMAADDFFWLLPNRRKSFEETEVPHANSYIKTEIGNRLIPALATEAKIIEIQNQIKTQQSFCDSKAQSLGGITGALGLVGVVLSLLDSERRASLFGAIAQVLTTIEVIPQESSIALTSMLETILMIIIFAVIVVLLRGLSNLYRMLYILELMHDVCAKQLTKSATVKSPDKKLSWWATLRDLLP